MGQLVFQATAGGQVALVGPNPSTNFALNVPAVNGNLVTTGDTGTVTNTMLASNVYTAPGTIGSVTPNTGAFTTLSASSTVSGTGFSNYLASPPAIGGTTAAAGSFTNLAYTGTLTGGTGVVNLGSGQFYKDASGNVGIGTSSPSSILTIGSGTAANKVLTINGGTGSGLGAGMVLQRNSTQTAIFSTDSLIGGTADGASVWSSEATRFYTGGSNERMRIDSSGNLLVGKTTTADTTVGWFLGAGSGNVGLSSGNYFIFDQTSGGSGYTFVDFRSAGTSKGSISYNGTLTLYNQTSDQRLKENIVDAGTALATVDKIKIRAFDWIESKVHESHGVIAQELKEIAPQCVTEGTNHKDGSMDRPWQIDTSPLVPMLIKAIQEQQALITSLTTRLTALENK